MTAVRKRRMLLLAAVLGTLTVAAALVLAALRDNLLFFYTPAQLQALPPDARVVRLGGMVEPGSVQRDARGLRVRFVVGDGQARIPVEYEGLLPDLFRESRGVVTSGRMGPQGVFLAHEVLAKHEETYAAPAGSGPAARPAWVQPR